MNRTIGFLLCAWLVSLSCHADNVRLSDVVWDSPSEGSLGSMPLGNGDIGMNVWTEPNGDVLFYISKVDAYDSGHRLHKLGCVRMRFNPVLDATTAFKQTLSLQDATISIEAADMSLELCVAANQPIIYMKGKSATPRTVTLTLEPLRPLHKEATQTHGTEGLLLDAGVHSLAWTYVNHTSEWYDRLVRQNTAEFVSQASDPIRGRMSGCLIQGPHLLKTGDYQLQSDALCKAWEATVRVESSQPGGMDEFVALVSTPVKFDRKGHRKYWKEFWNRSYINVESCGEHAIDLDQCRYSQVKQGALAYEEHRFVDAEVNAWQLTQRYALERFCEAIASRGEVPPPYNGSIFTMDMPAGSKFFAAEPRPYAVSPDERDWAQLSFMWQNTRHPYWSMATRGDYDCMVRGMEFVRDGLDVCKDHCRRIFGHDGAFIMEASWWHNVGAFDWESMPEHLRYHQLATIELPAIMCEYYEHTLDRQFLDSVLLPCADEFLKFYYLHFPERDTEGRYTMRGVGCAETFQGVTNPCTEIGCLKYLLDKLLSFDIDEGRRSRWEEFRSLLPADVPIKVIRGRRLLAVGDEYAPGRTNCESPELYSVYPFRQVWIGNPELLDVARLSFHVRTESLDGTVDGESTETGGWQAAPVQAAYLGLPREAARLVSINFNDQFANWNDNILPGTPFPNRPRTRFPAFWECKMDGTPDNDHGANSVNALQSMLLQADGDRIYLLPAWPEDWDVSFKLKASAGTTVACEYRDGRVVKLDVTPRSRTKDVINMMAPEQRVRMLVETAASDYNYLYSLPSMLDAQPLDGPVTSPWLAQLGYTIEGCKAGPWEGCLYRGNEVYVHLFDWDGATMTFPCSGMTPVGYRVIAGDARVVTSSDCITLSASDAEQSHVIVQLTFDAPITDVADSIICRGALFGQDELQRTTTTDGSEVLEKQFVAPVTLGRFEFSIDNPHHLRGHGKHFRLDVLGTDGNWSTAYEGNIYGLICGKVIKPMQALGVRLTADAEVTNFNVYKE